MISEGSSGGSLHERLRAATAGAHAALERDLDWQACVATREGYVGLLGRLRGFHAAYEPAIGAALANEAFFGPRRRLARLDADLTCLGADLAPPGSPEIGALAGPTVPALRDRAEAMGALYVLEGSTLGGLVIAKHIERLHGFKAETGAGYYRGHGRETAASWAAYRVALETLAGNLEAEARALAAGIATFDAMRNWLVPRPAPAA